MSTRAEAKFVISAKDQTQAGFASARRGADKTEKSFSRAKVAAAAFAAGSAAVVAGSLAIAAATMQHARSMDDAAKAAKRMQVSIETYEALTYAAQLNGAAAADVEKAWKSAGKRLYEASEGRGEAIKTLKALDIEVRNSNGSLKTSEQIMYEVAGAFEGVASAEEKAAHAQAIFGEGGMQLIPMLTQGADALRQQTAEGRALSVRTAEMAAKAEELIDSELRLNRAFTATKDVIYTALMPGFADAANFIADRLMTAVTGLDGEWRKMVATIATLPDSLFWEDVNAQILELLPQIDEAQKRFEEAKEVLRISGANATTLALQEYAEAITELEKQQKKFSSLQELVAQRNEQIANQERINAALAEERIRDQVAFHEKQLASIDEEIARLTELGSMKVEPEIDYGFGEVDIAGGLPDEFGMPMDEYFAPPEGTDDAFAEAGESAGERFVSSMGSAFSGVVTGAQSAADFFESAWMGAIDAVVQHMWEELAVKGLLKLASTVLGLPGLGVTEQPALLGSAAGGAGGGGNTYVTVNALAPTGLGVALRAAEEVSSVQRARRTVLVTRSKA